VQKARSGLVETHPPAATYRRRLVYNLLGAGCAGARSQATGPKGVEMVNSRHWAGALVCAAVLVAAGAGFLFAAPPRPQTFSIVAADPDAGEVGVAVASRFFAVGTVVPHARAGVGAVATQSYANTTYGPRGLELMERGLHPEEAIDVLLRHDPGHEQRQVGMVDATGNPATYTGSKCLAWAGGRAGKNYAAQGNILTGEDVVLAMESTFLETEGKPLAERLFLALEAGQEAGGDSRGKQSAAILVVREGAGYGGFTDRAVDIRVDDHATPFRELERLLGMALVNDSWNRGWTAFTEEKYQEALRWQEQTAERAEGVPNMLPEVLYDLAVIRLANEDRTGAAQALRRAVKLNPKLADQARRDEDLAALGAELEAIR
jgi:uncharacterized Ntn-hydrolase superfamily protein